MPFYLAWIYRKGQRTKFFFRFSTLLSNIFAPYIQKLETSYFFKDFKTFSQSVVFTFSCWLPFFPRVSSSCPSFVSPGIFICLSLDEAAEKLFAWQIIFRKVFCQANSFSADLEIYICSLHLLKKNWMKFERSSLQVPGIEHGIVRLLVGRSPTEQLMLA